VSGTTGQSKRLEAVQIRLTGQMAEKYDIYYRVHAQSYGWLGWAKNGAPAGTAGYAKRLEAIQILLRRKGGREPGSSFGAYRHSLIQYATHVQSYGWQGNVKDGSMSGTTGKAKRLEGIRIGLCDQDYTGNVEYRTHVQTYGWEKNWTKNGGVSGTTGQSKRLEAIQIRLTGQMAEKYDIYYQVHAQSYGWLDWAKNGAPAGTAGYAKRLEGIRIRLVAKGGSAPGSTRNPYISRTGI
ncbi:MAG: N-acetylmuramoyl-L-alanine amidase, partial [Lachnospiraceae bacterium]|nr:N-acetylmuramoyl-L-alanine amidase [Lachnospiraceae bacterium]